MRPLSPTQISVNPRLHLSLIGMNANGYRKNGGVGISIDNPNAVVEASKSNSFLVKDCRSRPLSAQDISLLESTLRKFCPSPVAIVVSGEVPSHSGFGTSTAIRLAALEAAAYVYDEQVSESELISASNRGGTSGIGINTYFTGGFVMDVGVKCSKQFLPSSSVEAAGLLSETPLTLLKLEMPTWEVGLCIPYGIPSCTFEQEKQFFSDSCPITDSEAQEILYHCTYGLAASIKESDFFTFCQSLNNIQKCKWKTLERQLHGDALFLLEKSIFAFGAHAVGMSSLGPSLFFFAEDIGLMVDTLKSNYPQHIWHRARLSNVGRTISC